MDNAGQDPTAIKVTNTTEIMIRKRRYFSQGTDRQRYVTKQTFMLFKYVRQWRVRLENFEGTGLKKWGLRGVTPSETHLFGSICLLPMENFATFLDFSFLFSIFLPL